MPAANSSVVLHAELENGQVVTGESKIPTYGERIKRVFLTPDTIEPLPESIQVIREADLIVITRQLVYEYPAKLACTAYWRRSDSLEGEKVYICNVMTQPGETLSYSAADHVQALNDHMVRPFIDTIFVNNKEIPEEIKAKYAEEQAQPVQFDTDVLKAMGLEVIPGEIITYDQHVIRHDTLKVASLLVDLLHKKK